MGSSRIAPHWNSSVRRKASMAEVFPSPNAVKNPEPKIFHPLNRKDRAKTRNPAVVISHRAWSYPTKNPVNIPARNWGAAVITRDRAAMTRVHLPNRLFSYVSLPAPYWKLNTGATPMVKPIKAATKIKSTYIITV